MHKGLMTLLEAAGNGKAQFVYPLTEAGLAAMFFRKHSKHVRYDHERGEWLVWNSRRGLRRKKEAQKLWRLYAKAMRDLHRQAKPRQKVHRNGPKG